MASIVAEVLGVERVGIAHDLYDTGADSLAVVELINMLEDEFDCDVSQLLVDANEQPIATVAAIAEFLRTGQTVVPDRAVAHPAHRPRGDRRATGVPPARDRWRPDRDARLCRAGSYPAACTASSRTATCTARCPTRALRRSPVGSSPRSTEREPDGPIVLGGFSFGAYVTYEMARQLRARDARFRCS